MSKLINGIKNSTLMERGLSLLGIMLISIFLMNTSAHKLARDNRLIRNEIRAMGFYEEAETVVLERAERVRRIYRTSVPIPDGDGRVINYWRVEVGMSFGVPNLAGEARAVPLYH